MLSLCAEPLLAIYTLFISSTSVSAFAIPEITKIIVIIAVKGFCFEICI